tara:strand:+ start:133 stop:273 length:141 start_codon:yes stop_codon:yes gene_type:complete
MEKEHTVNRLVDPPRRGGLLTQKQKGKLRSNKKLIAQKESEVIKIC